MKRWRGRIVMLALVAAAAVAVSRWMRPAPLVVDTARAAAGPMRVTVDEEGETRARDRFVIAAPVTGRLSRIQLREGDAVRRGQAVATLRPVPLDERASREGGSRVAAAEALEQEAQARVDHAEAEHALARKERERAETLLRSGDVAAQVVDRARTAESAAERELDAARHRAEAAARDVATARAALLDSRVGSGDGAAQPATVYSPVEGRLLQLMEQSERVVTAGTPLVVVGNAGRLEVAVDVLSSDAVKIQPGAAVAIEEWGGGRTLGARVRTVEPRAFRKVSALGVEERRVTVVADLDETPAGLGDGYRVEAKIVIWSAPRVLRIPVGAAFREGEQWRVFVVRQGVLERRAVTIGHRSDTEAEVVQGLAEGEEVVVRPGRDQAEGTRVTTAASMP